MKRRNFIKVITGFSVLSLGSYVLLPSFEKVVKKIIESSSDKLRINKNHINTFITEAENEKYWNQFSTAKKEFIRLQHFFDNRMISLPYGNKYLQYQNEIVGRFLLSTDFFQHKMDQSRDINYIGFYNPYKSPCSNPFTNIYYTV